MCTTRVRRTLAAALALSIAAAALLAGTTRRPHAVEVAMGPHGPRTGPGAVMVGTPTAPDTMTDAAGASADASANANAATTAERASARSGASTPAGPAQVAGTRRVRDDIATPSTVGAESLARWRAALGQRDSHPVDVVVVGDSITEGLAVPDDGRWTSQLRRDLQSRLNPAGTPGGEGFIPAFHTGRGSSTDPSWAQRWSLQNFPRWTDLGFGLGRRAVVIDTMNEKASITVAGDRLWISYTEGPDQGLMQLLVDGALPMVVDTYAAATRSGRVWDSGPLLRGNHRVEVSGLLGSRVVLDGITAFDGDGGAPSDHGRGVRMWEGGHSGYTSNHFGGSGAASWAQGLDNIRPDLVVVELGANDQTVGLGPDRFRDNLARIVDTIRAAATAGGGVAPSVAVMPIWAASNRSGAEWERYRAAMYAVATSKGCAVLDVWSSLPQAPAKPLPGGLFLDSVHLNLAGNAWLGDYVAHLLVP